MHMETVQYLLSKLVTVIVILSIFAFLYWMGTLLVPFLPKSVSFAKDANATSTEGAKDDFEFWLPTPGSFSAKGLDKGEYPYGRPVTEADFLRYDGSGVGVPEWPKGSKSPVILEGTSQAGASADYQTFDPSRSGFTLVPYVRSLSLRKDANVYAGLRFEGEAKESMFFNGMFLIYVVDPSGQFVGKGEARLSDDGARTEWRKFIGRITTQVGYRGKNCTLLFQQARPNGVRVYFPATCN